MVHRLARRHDVYLPGVRISRIEISIEAWEVATRYFEADSMTWLEGVASDTCVHNDLIGRVLSNKNRSVK